MAEAAGPEREALQWQKYEDTTTGLKRTLTPTLTLTLNLTLNLTLTLTRKWAKPLYPVGLVCI